jgi:ribulose-bisphosphate carboxylase small chain
MRLETFSYLPALSSEEVEAQVRSILERDLVVAIEHSPRIDPRDHYWTLWRLPLFAVDDASAVLAEIDACVREHPGEYVRVNGYDAQRQGQVASFVVHRPDGEP